MLERVLNSVKQLFIDTQNYFEEHSLSSSSWKPIDPNEVKKTLDKNGIRYVPVEDLLNTSYPFEKPGARETVLFQYARKKGKVGEDGLIKIELPQELAFLAGSNTVIISSTGIRQWRDEAREYFRKQRKSLKRK